MTGFQGIVERVPRGVTIYLLPGLTSRQRRAVIRRLRQEASRGCGPELPLAQLLVALFLDRIRGALRLAAGAGFTDAAARPAWAVHPSAVPAARPGFTSGRMPVKALRISARHGWRAR